MAQAPEDPTPQRPRTRRNRLIVLAAGMLATLLLLAFLLWWFALRDVRGDVWAETTVPLDPDCAGTPACQTAMIMPSGHNNRDGQAPIEFQYDPAVDTPIAQWGDCLHTLFVCIEAEIPADAQDDARAAGVRACMAEAQTCPDACRTRFAARTQGAGFARVEQIFFEDFVDPGGWCVPREADQ